MRVIFFVRMVVPELPRLSTWNCFLPGPFGKFLTFKASKNNDATKLSPGVAHGPNRSGVPGPNRQETLGP